MGGVCDYSHDYFGYVVAVLETLETAGAEHMAKEEDSINFETLVNGAIIL